MPKQLLATPTRNHQATGKTRALAASGEGGAIPGHCPNVARPATIQPLLHWGCGEPKEECHGTVSELVSRLSLRASARDEGAGARRMSHEHALTLP